MHQKDFLAKLDQQQIIEAIENAERMTSGEIRVHIQPKARGDIWVVAQRTFERLGMTKTDLRNGVLLFIACEEQRFVILGDKGINEGIVEAIHSAGEELRHDFPRSEQDQNELTNEISVEH